MRRSLPTIMVVLAVTARSACSSSTAPSGLYYIYRVPAQVDDDGKRHPWRVSTWIRVRS